MGTYKQGILGAFLGKVGNVVGSRWRGIDYMRSLATSVANPRTPAQVSNRNLFSSVVENIRPFLVSIRRGFIVSSSTSQWAQAVATNMAKQRQVVEPIGGVWNFDFAALQLTNGREQFSISVTGDADTGINVSWSLPADSPFEFGRVYAVLFNQSAGTAETFHTDASALSLSISGISAAASDVLRVYTFACSDRAASTTTHNAL